MDPRHKAEDDSSKLIREMSDYSHIAELGSLEKWSAIRMRHLLFLLAVLGMMSLSAIAEEAAPTAISPIFGRIVTFTLPRDFITISEQPTDVKYIREAVLKGETADRWSQMITVSGEKGIASSPQMSAQFFAAQIAGGFQRACPTTFTAKPVGPATVGGQEAFVAVASCGKIDASAEKHSETELIIAIKGAADVYTIRWTERSPSNAENLTIDEIKWKDRLAKLAPIAVCEIQPGEKPPYPSCSGK